MTGIAIGIEITTETEITMAIEIAETRRVDLIPSHAVKSKREVIRCGQFAKP